MDDVTAIVKKIPESHKNVINHILKKLLETLILNQSFYLGVALKGWRMKAVILIFL